jgi:hypothetical protein
MKASTLNQEDDWVDDLGDYLGSRMTAAPPRSSPSAQATRNAPDPPKTDEPLPKPEERPVLCQEAIVAARAKGIQDLAPAGYLAFTLNQILQDADANICQKYIGDLLKSAGERRSGACDARRCRGPAASARDPGASARTLPLVARRRSRRG